jgi:hypothetical protein
MPGAEKSEPTESKNKLHPQVNMKRQFSAKTQVENGKTARKEQSASTAHKRT